MNEPAPNLLQVKNLAKHFRLKGGSAVRAVDGVSFNLKDGETLSIVGESGCGKSTVARLIMRLYEPTAGSVIFNGENLLELGHAEMRARRKEMQLIFQDPYASLDTRKTAGYAIREPLIIHGVGDKESRIRRMYHLLETVGLDREAARRYPHEFSGGQRQRIGIARAIALGPRLVLADEPVSALDVSIQSQTLNLLVRLRQEFRLSYIFISHDLAVVKHISDRVAVMYLGRFVEVADVNEMFSNPLHPYTVSLISAIPLPRVGERPGRIILQGDVPDPSAPPQGCPFHPRCSKAMPVCSEIAPEEVNAGSPDSPHLVSCHLYRSG